MKYAKVVDNEVVNVIVSDEPLAGHDVLVDDTVGVGCISDGAGGFVPPAPAPVEVTEVACVAAVARVLHSQAVALGYDSIDAAVTYADEPAVPEYQAEGQALRAWRSNVWSACFAVLDAGLPATIEELTAALPAYV